MAQFQYKARNPQGQPLEGTVEAASADAVADQLFSNGATPIEIREAPSGGLGLAQLKDLQLWERKVSLDDLVMFSRQMYSLTRAGVPIIRAMAGLAETTKSIRLRRVLGAIAENLESGRSIGDSLRQHPDVFPSIYVSIIQVGENSGRLDESFLQISRHLELEKESRDRVKAALRYPMFVMVAMAVALAIINMFVIPAFSRVFKSFHTQLPLPTRILLATSEFSVNYWWLILLVVVALVGGFMWYIRTEGGEYRWDRFKLRIPIVGSIINRATLARFCRSFAMGMRSGVPLVQSLTVVSRATDNAYVASKIVMMRNGIERGESLTRTAATTGLFTPLVMQMLSVGEETGQVDDMMQEVAEYYEREVDYDLKRLSSYIEPILIIGIGVLVLILALGVFLPMWDLASAVRGGH